MNKLLTFFIFTLPLAFGTIYLPTRLYLIGQTRHEIVVAIEKKEETIHTGNYWMTIPYSSITLQNYPEPVDSSRTDFVIGQPVTLLYSDRLHFGVIVPDNYGYFSVLYHYDVTYGAARIIQAIAIFIGLIIAVFVRTQSLILHIIKTMTTSWHEALHGKKGRIEKIVAITDFLSQFSTMCVAIMCVFVFVALVIKVILLIEQTGLFLTTLTLIAASSIVLTPIPEKIMDAIINIKKTKILKNAVLILRNLVATVAGGILIYKLITFMVNEDFNKFESIKSVVLELISVLFG